MNSLDDIPAMQYILAGSLFGANEIDTLLDRELKEFNITSKQWLLSIVISYLFEEPPTMKEVAKEMRSSYQNVKNIALKLQEKGLLKLYKDEKDARANRLELISENDEFWARMQPKGQQFLQQLFEGFSVEELKAERSFMAKLLSNLGKMQG